MPGGKLERGETLEECLKRELSEEFGIDSMIGTFFASSDFQYENQQGRLSAFHVSVVNEEFKLTFHEQIKWVNPSELSLYDFAEADRPIIKKILTNFRLSM